MSVGYEPQWIRKWGKRTQCNNTCDIKISIWPEFECTQWILFSNINVLMCYNRRQHTHLGKVTKEEHLESEFLFLSCMYLSNPTVPISIYEGKKKKMKENICTFKTSTCKSKESSTRCVSKEKEKNMRKWNDKYYSGFLSLSHFLRWSLWLQWKQGSCFHL